MKFKKLFESIEDDFEKNINLSDEAKKRLLFSKDLITKREGRFIKKTWKILTDLDPDQQNFSLIDKITIVYYNTGKNLSKLKNYLETKHGIKMIHPYEEMNLGKHPFKFIGVYEMPDKSLLEKNPQAYYNLLREIPKLTKGGNGSCAYCGTTIKNIYVCKSSDGETFGVGSECINKSTDAALITAMKKAQQKIAREENQKKRETKIKQRFDNFQKLISDIDLFNNVLDRIYIFDHNSKMYIPVKEHEATLTRNSQVHFIKLNFDKIQLIIGNNNVMVGYKIYNSIYDALNTYGKLKIKI